MVVKGIFFAPGCPDRCGVWFILLQGVILAAETRDYAMLFEKQWL